MFARWILKPLNLIKITVVQLIVDGRKRSLNLSEVNDPARLLAQGSFDVDLHVERVPVKTSTFVSLWGIGQVMRRLKGELLKDLHAGAPLRYA